VDRFIGSNGVIVRVGTVETRNDNGEGDVGEDTVDEIGFGAEGACAGTKIEVALQYIRVAKGRGSAYAEGDGELLGSSGQGPRINYGGARRDYVLQIIISSGLSTLTKVERAIGLFA
jgi:hypothetical protein